MADTKPKAEALLPCPFCGGKARFTGPEGVPGGECWVTCSSCNATTLSRYSRETAAMQWNTRAALTPKPVEVAPDDEAHFKALDQCVHDCGGDDTDSQAVREYGYIAIEALRRRLAGLVWDVSNWKACKEQQQARAEKAEKALADYKAEQQAHHTSRIKDDIRAMRDTDYCSDEE